MQHVRLNIIACLFIGIASFAAEGENPAGTKVYVNEGEELLVHLQQHEMLFRKQIYREASIRAVERKARYERDQARAEKSFEAFKKELDALEKTKNINIERLETILKGSSEAEKIIGICLEGIIIVDTAIDQMGKHRALIQKSRTRVRKSLGAKPDQCGLHRVKMEPVRVPVVGVDTDAAKFSAASGKSPTSIMLRIRQFPCPAEAFVTDDEFTPRTPKNIVIPACPTCTSNHQAWVKSLAVEPGK